MEKSKEIGARIKALRIQNGLSQQGLADKLQYKSRSTINKIELGINVIHPTKIYAFARALNTSPEYLTGSNKDPILYDNKIDIMLEDGSIIKYTFNQTKILKAIKYLNKLEQE